MLAKNQINSNKMDNKVKFDNKNLDFTPFILNDINGHIEWEYPPLCGSFTRKIAQSAESSETAIFVIRRKIKRFVKSTVTEDEKL